MEKIDEILADIATWEKEEVKKFKAFFEIHPVITSKTNALDATSTDPIQPPTGPKP
jgi:hypothetical protein